MLSWIILVLCFSNSNEFLMDSSTPRQQSQGLTDSHYNYLLKLITAEKSARLELQQYVLQQQQRQKQQDVLISVLQSRVEQLEKSSAGNSTISCYKLEQQYNGLKQEQIVLEDRLRLAENKTKLLEEETELLKSLNAKDQLQSLNTVQKQIQRDVNTLFSQGQARGQDLIGLYTNFNDVKTAFEKNLSVLKTMISVSNLNLSTQITSLLHKQNETETKVQMAVQQLVKGRSIESQITSLAQKQNETEAKVQAALQQIAENRKIESQITSLAQKQNATESKVQAALHQIAEDRKIVGFTAYGKSYGTKPFNTTLKFPNIKSRFGLTDLSSFYNTGVWTCETQGLYLISVTVQACSTDETLIAVYIGNTNIGSILIGFDSVNTRMCNSGSGTFVFQLNSKDNLYIKTAFDDMDVYGTLSVLTVVKIG